VINLLLTFIVWGRFGDQVDIWPNFDMRAKIDSYLSRAFLALCVWPCGSGRCTWRLLVENMILGNTQNFQQAGFRNGAIACSKKTLHNTRSVL
jgi:hypothetical protein